MFKLKRHLIGIISIGLIIISLFLFYFVIKHTENTSYYKCTGFLINKSEKQKQDIYFKLQEYHLLKTNSRGYIKIEIPNKINSLLYLNIEKIDSIIFFSLRKNDYINRGQFSKLSNNLIFIDEIWGSFNGNCEKITR
jgi:hypothetical protein